MLGEVNLSNQREPEWYHGKREEDGNEEESKFQKACQKWENLSTDSLLGTFCTAKGRWRKCSSCFSLTQTHSYRTSHWKCIRVYQLPTRTLSAGEYLKRESGIGIQGKHYKICALRGSTGHQGMRTRARVSTWIRLEVCTVQGPMN